MRREQGPVNPSPLSELTTREERNSGQELNVVGAIAGILVDELLINDTDGPPDGVVRARDVIDHSMHHSFRERVVEMHDERLEWEFESSSVAENRLNF
jgi:hypothetical protein